MSKGKEKVRGNWINRIRHVNDWYFVICMPLLAFIITETAFRGNIGSFFSWISERPTEAVLTFIVLCGLVNIGYVCNKKVYILTSFIITMLLVLGGFISRLKLDLRGEPLLPGDLRLVNEASNITQSMELSNIGVIAFVLGILLVLSVIFAYFVKNEKFKVWKRVGVTLVAFLIVWVAFTNKPFDITDAFKVTTITYDQQMNSEQNGFTLGFLLNTRWMKVDKPSDYNEQTVAAILEKYEDKASVGNKKPNIIFVQSEAFWDPLLLGENLFSEDPIPFFRSLQQKHTSGNLRVPVYGGGTVNTEFEAITGLSTRFLPSGSIAFAQYLKNPVLSMPRSLESIGYKATGIHSYHSWFYRRTEAYRNLGFTNFIGQEYFFNPQYKGDYIFDNDFVQRIVSEVKATEQPDYIYGVSMQGHGPYQSNADTKNKIKVTKNIDKASKQILESYASTMKDVDNSLQELVTELEKVNEPSIVVFYGDHLPMLGDNYQVYKQLGFMKNLEEETDYNKMHTVPLVIWSNYLEKQEDVLMGSYMLPAYVLNLANLNQEPLYRFMDSMYEAGYQILPSHVEDRTDKWLVDYRILNYDNLFGKQFSDYYHLLNDNKNFYLGSEKLSVGSLTPNVINREAKEDQEIVIKGQGFAPAMRVYVDSEMVETVVSNENQALIKIPKKLFETSKQVNLHVEIVDSMDRTISSTNKIPIQVVNETEFNQKSAASMKKIEANKLSWEFFKEATDYTIIRANLNKVDVPYSFKMNGKVFEDANADYFDRAGLANLYVNGYFYISVNKAELAKFASVNEFMKHQQVEFFIVE
ncbi:LTA synthase family protein [Bacillus massiliigorillae]|uniref:LTA synthase family protein n=1 Tax=Bacillus massiliigorillae TaxID=1243664 RepID=UPI0003A3B750|nr:LTA synthase family protein [Bacillus massiliigorillae]